MGAAGAGRLMERLFLTGGTGLAGSHVAARFREKGTEVRALHRDSSDTSFLESLGCELVAGDVRDDRDTLARAMDGCDALVHAASLVYADLPWPRVRGINVEGTGGVFRGALAVGVTRAVHLSSVAVYGIPDGEVDEGSPTDRPLLPRERYARSKREAETVVREVAEAAPHLHVAILRPTAIYGERDRLFTPRLAGHLRRKRQVLPGGGRTPLPLVYAGNLATAVEAALTQPLPEPVRAYNVTADAPVSLRDFYGALARALGTEPRFVSIPGPLVRLAARAADALGLHLPDMEEVPSSPPGRIPTTPTGSKMNWAGLRR
jgi:2-alkyl-3-oxoalkanoate reductase